MVWLVPMANAAAVTVLARYASGEQRPGLAATLFIIFRNPFIWATFIGIAINLAGLSIYPPLFATLGLLGGGAIAASLLMVGAGLMLADAFPPTRVAVAGCLLKLIGMPLVVFAWAAIFGNTGTPWSLPSSVRRYKPRQTAMCWPARWAVMHLCSQP